MVDAFLYDEEQVDQPIQYALKRDRQILKCIAKSTYAVPLEVTIDDDRITRAEGSDQSLGQFSLAVPVGVGEVLLVLQLLVDPSRRWILNCVRTC